jgi:hypothetical protein
MSERRKPPSERARVRRLPERGRYDRATIDAILDAMPLAHLGTVIDGAPVVTPTLQWREGDRVYWHGSAASRMLRSAADHPVCLTVSLLDGLVLARSAFHHSVNYRSVMLFGQAEKVSAPADKERLLRAFLDGLYPGRWTGLRPMTPQELKATTVLSMPIDEASAKLRCGPPKDDEADYALPIWAGVVPVQLSVLAPEPDPRNRPEVEIPATLKDLRLG